MQILLALSDSTRPLAAAEVLERILDADRVTVYRTLNTLAARHMIHRIQGEDRVWRYALDPQNESHKHVHFACDRCGSVRCLENSPIPTNLAESLQIDQKYRVSSAEITLHGTCPQCHKS